MFPKGAHCQSLSYIQGDGIIVIPEEDVPAFKKLLVSYYEDKDSGEIVEFMKSKCWKNF